MASSGCETPCEGIRLLLIGNTDTAFAIEGTHSVRYFPSGQAVCNSSQSRVSELCLDRT